MTGTSEVETYVQWGTKVRCQVFSKLLWTHGSIIAKFFRQQEEHSRFQCFEKLHLYIYIYIYSHNSRQMVKTHGFHWKITEVKMLSYHQINRQYV